ncbi:hypothetical protein XA68_12571 [Ophiocordyceps unilateralis]|uniref:Uncharacterized protein n=1 Tax=Ophiocordyceps unilateralis TaxID=268505 RepID=A0A2A9PDB4_OPHUN|nr:hypothetical protein XA68_12571 [Ophiocordyceps unilateralis]
MLPLIVCIPYSFRRVENADEGGQRRLRHVRVRSSESQQPTMRLLSSIKYVDDASLAVHTCLLWLMEYG